MMRGPIVCQLWWEDLLYASYDERTYCMPVMMRGPTVHQLWWEDLLYASYDERTYCTPVTMRGPIVRQLWWEDLLYASYVGRCKETKKILKWGLGGHTASHPKNMSMCVTSDLQRSSFFLCLFLCSSHAKLAYIHTHTCAKNTSSVSWIIYEGSRPAVQKPFWKHWSSVFNILYLLPPHI